MPTVTRKIITAPGLRIGEGRTRPAAGVVVSTSITAGGVETQDVEGVVLSTSVTAGGLEANHSEGVAVSTPIIAGGIQANHGEDIVVSTSITAGGHCEMLVDVARKDVAGFTEPRRKKSTSPTPRRAPNYRPGAPGRGRVGAPPDRNLRARARATACSAAARAPKAAAARQLGRRVRP